jgi:2-polyprenyl-3-methyl-5-hydroxy-6-metoxy-1,4-benzoquinol methylase
MNNRKYSVDYNEELKSSPPNYIKFIDKLLPNSNLDRRDVVGKLLPGGSSILDLGSGSGVMLRKYGIEKYRKLCGLDIAKKPLEKFEKWAKSKKANYKIYHGDFLEIKIREKFDTIAALAYLEHQLSPFQHLKKISGLLKKDGTIILETPNIAYLLFRLSLLKGKFPITAHHKGCIPGVVDAHIRFFTPETMAELLEYCGFKVEMMTCSGRLQSIRAPFKFLWPDIVVVAKKVKKCPKLNPIQASQSD